MEQNWIFWILSSSVSLSLYDLCKKASVRNNAAFPTLFVSTLSGWLAVTAFVFASGRMESVLDVTPFEIGCLSVKSCIVASSWAATYAALKTMPITTAAPIRASGPFWTLLGAMVLFSELPRPVQTLGIVFVLSGCVFFSVDTKKDMASGGRKALLLAFAGTVLGSASALYDKHLMQNLNLPALAVLWWFLGGMTIIYAAISSFRHSAFQWRITMPLVGILLAVSDACYFQAISMPEAQISVLSLVRRSSIVLTFFVGGAVFRERGIGRKTAALAAILAGVVILCLAR